MIKRYVWVTTDGSRLKNVGSKWSTVTVNNYHDGSSEEEAVRGYLQYIEEYPYNSEYELYLQIVYCKF
jgi:hypothetical protein